MYEFNHPCGFANLRRSVNPRTEKAVMIYEIFIFGSVWWWLLIATASVLIILALDDENGKLSTSIAVATILLWQFFGDLNIQSIETSSVWTYSIFLAGYVGVGITWSVIKWFFYVGKKREEYEELKLKWLKSQGVHDTNEVPQNLKKQFRDYICQQMDMCDHRWEYDERTERKVLIRVPAIKPHASSNKGKIISWMAYWPWSMAWALLDDIWHRVFKWVQARMSNIMNAISDWQFKGVENDFAEEPTESNSTEEEIVSTP